MKIYKKGDRITYRRSVCEIDITQLQNHRVLLGGFIDVGATVVGSAKGTEFLFSDLIVTPDDYKQPTGIVYAAIIEDRRITCSKN